tara:strand:+ start:64 stop:426 length:363 start_codon:yes stop_codon:yes gene_type:complete
MQTIGEFYKENILCRNDLVEVELPTNWGDLRVEQDLFGWKLYGGRKEFIECKSEEEARYLYIFLDLGMTEVNVPKDDAYLKKILPKLEKLKKRIDEIVNSYLRTVLNRKIHNEFCGLISP